MEPAGSSGCLYDPIEQFVTQGTGFKNALVIELANHAVDSSCGIINGLSVCQAISIPVEVRVCQPALLIGLERYTACENRWEELYWTQLRKVIKY